MYITTKSQEGHYSMNRNMNARNFGLRSRNINMAAKNALVEGLQSYSSVATMTSRFKQFSQWENETYGVKDLRFIEKGHLQQYAKHLNERINVGDMAVSTAQNYVSAVNRVMEIARGDQLVHVSPTDYLPNRTSICTANKAIIESDYKKLQSLPLDNLLSNNQMAASSLIRAFGLRQKESALLDLKQALKEARNNKSINIINGTKGGRPRLVPVRTRQQLEIIRQAANIQGIGRSLIPSHMNYRQWKDAIYKAIEKSGVNGLHGGRHLYSQRLYELQSGVKSPISLGIKHGAGHFKFIAKTLKISIQAAKKKDHEARLVVAKELGHGRTEITNKYLG